MLRADNLNEFTLAFWNQLKHAQPSNPYGVFLNQRKDKYEISECSFYRNDENQLKFRQIKGSESQFQNLTNICGVPTLYIISIIILNFRWRECNMTKNRFLSSRRSPLSWHRHSGNPTLKITLCSVLEVGTVWLRKQRRGDLRTLGNFPREIKLGFVLIESMDLAKYRTLVKVSMQQWYHKQSCKDMNHHSIYKKIKVGHC